MIREGVGHFTCTLASRQWTVRGVGLGVSFLRVTKAHLLLDQAAVGGGQWAVTAKPVEVSKESSCNLSVLCPCNTCAADPVLPHVTSVTLEGLLSWSDFLLADNAVVWRFHGCLRFRCRESTDYQLQLAAHLYLVWPGGEITSKGLSRKGVGPLTLCRLQQ